MLVGYAAFAERGRVHAGGDVVDAQLGIQGHAHEQVVDGLSGQAGAGAVGVVVVLGVVQLAFHVPQAIGAGKATEGEGAGVQRGTVRGGCG